MQHIPLPREYRTDMGEKLKQALRGQKIVVDPRFANVDYASFERQIAEDAGKK